MNDSRQRFLFENAPIRGEIVHLNATWRAVLERHEYPLPLRTVLGELMAAGALLAATLKFDGSITLQLQGKGPVKLIVVECTSEDTMRATAKWDGEITTSDLAALLGDGRFVITLIPGGDMQPYQGIVDIDAGGVAASLEHYMRHSQQIETRLWLATDNTTAAGLLLQKLPEREEADSDDWDRALHLAGTVRPEELLRLEPRELLHRLYHEDDLRLFEAKPMAFRCSCSRERVAAMLRMLGYDEVKSIIVEREAVDVNCEFCNRAYRFDAVDAEQVFAAEHGKPAGQTRH